MRKDLEQLAKNVDQHAKKHTHQFQELEILFREQDETIARHTEALTKQSTNLQSLTQFQITTMLPPISATIYLATFRIGFQLRFHETLPVDKSEVVMLRDMEDQFEDFGMRSAEEMGLFATTVSTVLR